ncbi:response regulator transcription factor [Noviherbaspirillum sp. ST9]|uniref:response regulator transcription factor n=1 Tax=Noviherbaspirillum sp. ST9 TaxID=3401606 RepID=UPI003B587337
MSTSFLIIVVDDDEQVRRALGRVLRAHGFATREFASGEELLAAELPPAGCLLLDIELGGMSGLELYRAVVQRENAAPPAVFVTGKASPAAEATARALGAAAFLYKPVGADDLLSSIRHAGARCQSMPA